MNYFEYFSEIEERFVARRGSLLLLSTLDWALIETWREADVPLAAVLRGIDNAFDKYETRKARSRGRLAKVNGLAWCAQAVMEAAAEMADAAVGGRPAEGSPERRGQETGFEQERIARFLLGNAAALESQPCSEGALSEARETTAVRLHELAGQLRSEAAPALDELDRTLTVLEQRLQAALFASVSESDMVTAREAADRELAPYRARMGAVQMRQVRDQFVQKKLFQTHFIPRLSLFYMPSEEPPETPANTGQN